MPTFDSSLDFALQLLAVHPNWHLFPIKRYEKQPPLIENNLVAASNDPKQIRAWHAKWRGCNWGLALKKSHVIVVDVDRKPGKVGADTLADLELRHGESDAPAFPDTLTVTSPSGGLHFYYDETDRVQFQYTQGKYGFGPDIDTPNYVLIPGCWLCTQAGYDVERDLPIAPAPDWFGDYIKKRETVAADTVPVADVDADPNVAWCIDWLVNMAPPSIEGHGGEKTLLQVAGMLKDRGISETMAIDLLAEHYNVFGKCDPLWCIGEGPLSDRLDVKVHNAYTYLVENAVGADTPQAAFEADEVTADEVKRLDVAWKLRAKFGGLGEAPTKADIDAELAKAEGTDDDEAEEDGVDSDPAETPEEPGDPPNKGKAAASRVKNRPANEQGRVWTIAELMDEWVYIESIKRFVWRYDLDFRNHVYDTEAFDAAFMYLHGKYTKVSKRLLDRDTLTIRKFVTMGYLPGEDEFVGPIYNLYRESKIKPTAGNTDLWDEHLNYLFQDPTERDAVLNWCAWLLQHIGEKPMHALLLAGYAQGTGKTFIAKVMGEIVGRHNVAPIKDAELESQFNEWALKAKLLVIEELQALDRGVVKKKLHELITETSVIINDKNIKRFKAENCFGIIAMSNEDAAIRIEQNDRRYLVARTHAMPREKAYYDRLYAILKDPVALGAIYHQLMTRDLGEYAGTGRAPTTQAKADMIEAGMSDLEHWIVENTANPPLCHPVVNLTDILEVMPNRISRQPRVANNLAMLLRRRLNARMIGQFRLPDKRRERLWAIGPRASMIDEKNALPIYTKYFGSSRKSAESDAATDFDEGTA